MKQIFLTRGFSVMVDDEDYGGLSKNKWCVAETGRYKYAVRFYRIRGKGKTVYMHREIMGAKKGDMIDHINGNTLDNQKSNLRFCNHSTNAMNKIPKEGKQYKGVCKVRVKSGKNINIRWEARIKADGKKHFIGIYKTEKDAVEAYNKAAKHYHKDFAKLNIYEKHYPFS